MKLKKIFIAVMLATVCISTTTFALDKPESIRFVVFQGYYEEPTGFDLYGDKHHVPNASLLLANVEELQSWRISPFHDYFDTPRFDLAATPGCYTQDKEFLRKNIEIKRTLINDDSSPFHNYQCFDFTLNYRDLKGRNGLLGTTDYIKLNMQLYGITEGVEKLNIECYLNYDWWGNYSAVTYDSGFCYRVRTDDNNFPACTIRIYNGNNPVLYIFLQKSHYTPIA